MPTFGKNSFNKIVIKNNIPHTPTKVGGLVSIIFSHTPDEAMSVGLVKASIPGKYLFCNREIELPYYKFMCLCLDFDNK